MPSRAAECTAETTAETFRLETKRRKLKRGTLRERETAAERRAKSCQCATGWTRRDAKGKARVYTAVCLYH